MKPYLRSIRLFCVLLSFAATRCSFAQSAVPVAPADRTAIAGKALRLLKENCVSCHNPEKQKADLALTTRERLMQGGESGPAVVAGKAAESRLIAVLSPEADPHMPPKGQLTPDEIDTLRRWIDGGAAWDAAAFAAETPATRPVALKALPAAYRPVMAVALASDQKRLAVGRGDRILVFDVQAKEPAVVFQAATPNEPIYALAWSPDGKRLASGGYRHVRLWDLQSPNPVLNLTGPAGRVTALAFTPDGGALLAGEGDGGADGILRRWKLPEGTPEKSWTAHRDSVLSLKLSGDGKLLVTGGADNRVKVWDRDAGKELANLEGHAGAVMAVALSADGTRLATAGAGPEIMLWDVKTRELRATLLASPGGVTDLHWVDPKRLLASGEDGVVRLANEEYKNRAERSLAAAPDTLYGTALSADGKTLYAGCHDGNVYVWVVASGKLQRTLAAPEAGAAETNAASPEK